MKLKDLSVKKLHAVWDKLAGDEPRPTGKKPEIVAFMEAKFGEEVDAGLLEDKPKDEFAPAALAVVAEKPAEAELVEIVALKDFKRTFGWTTYILKTGDRRHMDASHARCLALAKLAVVK